ncbi:uncharacterized protein J8A68_001950 [[Candida] subhashii]|uniref:Uncharacterized protein n=1 Tax=[Candida] subhashii TaxID=561895 RepID=A0A8J5QN24_9ASCO|nr:uncharacterized protein J8A68_001950 [[Candida] subhashii]KAG7664524.1 hypothetical protein J8A68_001950 [[Candida] subhashii]
MSIRVILPNAPISSFKTLSKKVNLTFTSVDDNTTPIPDSIKTNFGVPIFILEGHNYVLIKHLAGLWNYPSSYQLIARLIKKVKLVHDDFQKTNEDINKQLFESNVIDNSDLKFELFYISLEKIYYVIENKQVFFNGNVPPRNILKKKVIPVLSSKHEATPDVEMADENDNEDDDEDEDEDDVEDEEEDEVDDDDEEDDESIKVPKNRHKRKKTNLNETKSSSDDIITVNQVFPQYGLIDSTIQLNHASFSTVNSLTKLNYYKNLPSSSHKFLPNTKLTFAERELILGNNNYFEMLIDEDRKLQTDDKKRFRKPIGKSKKHNIHIDPNTIDLGESVIPGQGYVPEFSVNHICKVPNYYITSNHQSVSAGGASQASFFNMKRLNATSNSSFLFNENIKMSKNIQQLVFSNDSDNYHHSKYYYTKTYRGPGSGNYKDAALMNKINRIPVTTDPIRKVHKNKIQPVSRVNRSLKGLLYDKFNKDLVENVLAKQRKFTEDYSNLEMLHNNLQFNLLLNSYREIAQETWDNYYKFKLIDFEQLKALQREQEEIEARKQAIAAQNEYVEQERQRQEKIRTLLEQERSEFENLQREQIQKQKQIEEKNRQRQLEASFSDPFIANSDDEDEEEKEKLNYEKIQQEFEEKQIELRDKFEQQKQELMTPTPPPTPIETPQLDIVNRFSSPAMYPEIVRNLPLELRGTEQVNKDDIPPIKKPIRYVATYPEGGRNPEYLTKIEIIKLPNANCVGWDNLRKYKDQM